MNKKTVLSAFIVLAMAGLSQSAIAKGKPVRGAVCDGKAVNVLGTNRSDTIFINDDNTYIINGGTPISFIPPAVVSGGNGNDIIAGSFFDDTICGGNGNDAIKGGSGSDRIFGQNGKDTLDGDDATNPCIADPNINLSCNDYVTGDNGNDNILGGEGDDMLYGDNGTDTIDGGIGIDLIEGGRGKDTCSADAFDADNFIECEKILQ